MPIMNEREDEKTMAETSATMRHYLAEIYRLQENSPTVSTTILAERLNVSAPAVPRMLKRLHSAGLVKHVPYQGVELSDLGRKQALLEIRRHRILEAFLVQVMGFSWDETHDHAESMGQGLTDTVVERMAQMTNYPTRCPHGEPIPTADGEIHSIHDSSIMNLGIGARGTISRVRTHESEKLRYFSSLGIMPQTPVEIIGRAPFNGPLRLKIGRDEVVIGAEIAQALWVSVQSA